jgi:hypothetical protein
LRNKIPIVIGVLLIVISTAALLNILYFPIQNKKYSNITYSIKINPEYGLSPIAILDSNILENITNINAKTINSLKIGLNLEYSIQKTNSSAKFIGNMIIIVDGEAKKSVSFNTSIISNKVMNINITKIDSEIVNTWINQKNTIHNITFKISPESYLITNPINNEKDKNIIIYGKNITIYIIDNADKLENNYLVTKINSKIVVNNFFGKQVVSESDLGVALNSLFKIIQPNSNITISSGIYEINTPIKISVNNIKIEGEKTAIIRPKNNFNSPILSIKSDINNIIIKNLVFDANLIDISPVVSITGNRNTVDNCTVMNAIQYGLLAYSANNFKLINNKVNKAQYGIATGGTGSIFCTNGLIQNNTITDCRENGIKLRWCQNVTVARNNIDVKWITWKTGSWSYPTGICFYGGDGPTINVIVENNTIHNSNTKNWTINGEKYYSVGIYVAQDIFSNWEGYTNESYNQIVKNNTITGMYYGIQTIHSEVYIAYNKINETNDGIYINSNANSCTIKLNFIKNYRDQQIVDKGKNTIYLNK